MLNSKYHEIERLLILQHFVHDTDLKLVINILVYVQEHLENLLRMLRNCMTNDEIRDIISKMTKEEIKRETRLVNFMTLKGWIKSCPRFHHVPKTIKEKISAAEAYHLWDHLCLRYDNIEQTRLFLAYV